MESGLVSKKIVVKKSLIHGYGVFALEDIAEGEIIEECHTLITNGMDETLQNYYFHAKEESAIPLGFGCIYNHSDRPNASYFFDQKKELMIFKAQRLIRQGEEIFTSYGKNWFDGRAIHKKELSRWRKILQPASSMPMRALIALSGVGLTAYILQQINSF